MIEQLLQADRLLIVDQVEQARGVYARVVELDPGNAIAVVGLARCALADGDDRAAHELAAVRCASTRRTTWPGAWRRAWQRSWRPAVSPWTGLDPRAAATACAAADRDRRPGRGALHG